jgi:riboflavin biosynthesis pyrimidine reductase
LGKVVFDISMSLDGFMTAANQRPEEPLGEGGERLHEWALGDELSIHLVPVLFGGGTRMFEHLGGGHLQLENLGSVQTAAATHLRFRVVR